MFRLKDYQLISVSGPDSERFLQGQITCDLHSLKENQASLGACCDHKGRAITSFLVLDMRASNSPLQFLLWLRQDASQHLLEHLEKYACFSKVTLKLATDWHAFGSLEPLPGAFQLPNTPSRWLTLNQQPDNTTGTFQPDNNWEAAQGQAGVCLLTGTLAGKIIPLSLNYESLGGISFNKGCYVGQEIIARAHYRGQLKRHLQRLTCQSSTPVTLGSSVTQQGQAVGHVVACWHSEQQWHVLAVVADRALAGTLYINEQVAKRS